MRETGRRRAPQRHRVTPVNRLDRGTPRELVAVPEPREGYTFCEECRQQVRLKPNGVMQAHRTRSKVPCIAAPSSAGEVVLCPAHGEPRHGGRAGSEGRRYVCGCLC